MWIKQKVLVTGGAGFIGSELVRQLATQDIEVVIIDNLVNGRRENLEGLFNDQVRLFVADIRDDHIADLMKGVDLVFHLACVGVRHSIHSPYENHEINATGTLKLLVAARAAGVKRFVCVSSSEVYGITSTVPITEQHCTFPMTVYGGSKLAGESYTRAFYQTYGYPTVVVRPFNAYGPRCHHEGDSGEVIPKFLLRCMSGRPMVIFGDGKQTRDFTYVSDTARGILSAGLSDGLVGKTINIGSGRETTINDLAREIAAVLEQPNATVIHDLPRPGDVRRLWADISNARSLLKFQPTIELRDGLIKLRDWYTSRGQSPDVLLEREIVHSWVKEG